MDFEKVEKRVAASDWWAEHLEMKRDKMMALQKAALRVLWKVVSKAALRVASKVDQRADKKAAQMVVTKVDSKVVKKVLKMDAKMVGLSANIKVAPRAEHLAA